MRLLTTEEYLATERPALSWLVKDLVPDPGVILIEGPPKGGKSFLAYDLARSISQGVPFLNRQTKQARTLYLQFDTSELIWRERLVKIRDGGTDISGPLFTVHPEDMQLPLNILNPSHRLWLKEVVEHCNPALTVLDVYRELHNADENDSTQMKIVGDALTNIFKERCLVLVHHSKKIGEDNFNPDPTSSARGSSYITGKVDGIWLVWNNKLKIHSRISEPIDVAIRQGPTGLWSLAYPTADKLDEAVLQLCHDFPTSNHHSLSKLAEQQLGVSKNEYFKIMSKVVCPHAQKSVAKIGLNTLIQKAVEVV